MPKAVRKPSRAPRPPGQQAESLRRSRRDRAMEVAQDYVEAIADLSASLGEARVVDLARRLGVTHVTVNRTMARLGRAGYVSTKPYRAIFLTDAGRQLAEECKRRHETVVAFLRSVGVPENRGGDGRRGDGASRQPRDPGCVPAVYGEEMNLHGSTVYVRRHHTL